LLFSFLAGLGELVVELGFELKLALQMTLSPFLSASGVTGAVEHFARISRRLLAAVLRSAQVGVSWNVGKRIICGQGGDEVWDVEVDIIYVCIFAVEGSDMQSSGTCRVDRRTDAGV
jgi:hypothetical protein